VNLVRAIFEPLPAPVIVEPPARTVERTVIVTGPGKTVIPEYSYVLYEDEYIPYYEGWIFLEHDWHWVGAGRRPPKPPKWTPPPRPRHQAPPHHKVIARLDHHPGHGPGHGAAPVIRREERRPEPPRTVVVRPEQKEKKVRTERKEKEKVTVTPDRRKDQPPKKGR
jgi:hypothetical protein